MGLEGVELIMAIEDRFCTSLPDTKTERFQTIGDVHNFLMARIQKQNSEFCPATAMFYPSRRILVDKFNVDRARVKPSASLGSLLDAESRKQFWRTIEVALSTQLPGLIRTGWLTWSPEVFPPECSTVSQLVEQCIDLNQITVEFNSEDGEAVFAVLRQLVADVSGVDQSTLTPKTNFVNDLGF